MLPSEEIRAGLDYGLTVVLWFLALLGVAAMMTSLLFALSNL